MEELLLREDSDHLQPIQGSEANSSSSSSSRGSSSSRDTVLSCGGVRGEVDSYVAGSWHPDYLDSVTADPEAADPPFVPGENRSMDGYRVVNSAADPDPKDLHHFAGSKIFCPNLDSDSYMNF